MAMGNEPEAARYPSAHNPDITYGHEDDRNSDDIHLGKKITQAKKQEAAIRSQLAARLAERPKVDSGSLAAVNAKIADLAAQREASTAKIAELQSKLKPKGGRAKPGATPQEPSSQQPSPQHVAAAKQVMDKASRIADPGVMIGYLRQQLGKAPPQVQQAFAASAGLTADDTPEQVVAKLQKASGAGEQAASPKVRYSVRPKGPLATATSHIQDMLDSHAAGKIPSVRDVSNLVDTMRASLSRDDWGELFSDLEIPGGPPRTPSDGAERIRSFIENGGSRHDNPREDRTARGTPEPVRDRPPAKLPHGTQVRGGAIRLPKRKVKAWHPWLTGEGR